MNSIFKDIWSDSAKWIMGFISAIIVSLVTAWITTTYTLQNELDEGQAVFNSIGYRYFAAIIGSYNHETLELLEDEEVWNKYRKIVVDIQEDIRWLRTNPLYGEIQQNTASLSFAQNMLAAESASTEMGADGNTLHFMCEIFIKQEYWKKLKTEDKTAIDVYKFATRLCEHQN